MSGASGLRLPKGDAVGGVVGAQVASDGVGVGGVVGAQVPSDGVRVGWPVEAMVVDMK